MIYNYKSTGIALFYFILVLTLILIVIYMGLLTYSTILKPMIKLYYINVQVRITLVPCVALSLWFSQKICDIILSLISIY